MSSTRTNHTLIQRATDLNDHEAWREFSAYYRRFILYILHQLRVAPDDIEDVTQMVLMKLMKHISSYDRELARFRTWLSKLIYNEAYSNFRKRGVEQKHFEKLEDTAWETKFSNNAQIESQIEKEWALYITSQAMENVRKVFKGQAVRAFELGLEGHSAEDIAQKTELSVASVYTLRKRVKKRLFLEVRALTADLEP